MTNQRQYPRWRPRHEEVLRWILENPRGRQIDCAMDTGYSIWQISRIVNSPAFRHELDRACEEGRREAYARWMGRDSIS
jgi:hypothetical protein